MCLKLTENWREILRRAWSIRLMLLAGLLSAAEVVLPFFEHIIPRGIFAGLSAIAVSSAFIARLLAQSKMKDEKDE